jgi:hypothetical protein
MALPRCVYAIVADGHPAPDLEYFEVHPLPCPSLGHLEIFAVRFLVSYAFNVCVRVYVMIAISVQVRFVPPHLYVVFVLQYPYVASFHLSPLGN